MKRALVILLMLPALAWGGDFQQEVLRQAESLSYIREKTGHNDHPAIDKMLAYQGLPKGLSWCLAFCVYCYHLTADEFKVKNPMPKMARCSLLWQKAKGDWRYTVVTSEEMAWGTKVNPADVGIFSHNRSPGKDNWDGHAVLVTKQIDAHTIRTIEGNTGHGPGGNQREGNGVYHRIRTVGTWSLHLEGFVRPAGVL